MQPTPVKAVIFDRDGTILNFYEMFHRFIADLCQEAGEARPSRDEILDYAYWESVIAGAVRIGQALVKDRLDDVPLRYMRYGSLYPGAARAIRLLAGHGVRVAVVSSWAGTRATTAFLRDRSLLEYVEAVVTCDDYAEAVAGADNRSAAIADNRSAAIKEAVIQIAMTRLGVEPSGCVVVGDSPDDVAAGRSLGARTAAVLTGNGTRLRLSIEELGPTWILPAAADVTSVVEQRETT